MTITQAAALLNIGRSTILGWIRDGRIKPKLVTLAGANPRYEFSASDLPKLKRLVRPRGWQPGRKRKAE